jgi:hypothetical protein
MGMAEYDKTLFHILGEKIDQPIVAPIATKPTP